MPEKSCILQTSEFIWNKWFHFETCFICNVITDNSQCNILNNFKMPIKAVVENTE